MNLLDNRLNMVLSLVPKGSVLLDVGTDHCKLPAEALLSGRVAAAFAGDLRPGPLAAAKKQLSLLGLEDRIPLFLSDGVREIPHAFLEKVTVVVIAGMGGEAIFSIMQNAPIEPPLWVLQPMSAIYELIDGLAAGGYEILREGLAQDQQKFYRGFAVRKDGKKRVPNYFGMLQNTPLYSCYLGKEEKRVLTALTGLKNARVTEEDRIAQEEKLLCAIRKAKK